MERMIKLSELAKQTIAAILVIAFTFLLGSLLYYRSLDFIPYMIGLVLGSVVSVVKVMLVERAVEKALRMDQQRVGGYVGGQYLLRMLLTAVVLIIGALVSWISLWGVAAGVIAFQLGIYLVQLRNRIGPRKVGRG
jgi:hypothetical protein